MDGAYYEGVWSDNKACGFGKFVHPNGDYYEGEWKDNMANKGRGSIFKLMGRLMKGNGKMIFSKGHLELKFGRMGALFLAIIIMEKKMAYGITVLGGWG